jgi:hypothetical protein
MSHPLPHSERLVAEMCRPSLIQGLLLMLAASVVGGAYFLPSWTTRREPSPPPQRTFEPPADPTQQALQWKLEMASQHFQARDWTEAARAYREITQDHPEIGLAWHRLAYVLHVDGHIDEAIPNHEEAAKFEKFKPVSLYNLACAYALKKDAATALKYLRQALDAGFNGWDYLKNDKDLDFIRGLPEFKKLCEEATQRAAKVSTGCPSCAQACPDTEPEPSCPNRNS